DRGFGGGPGRLAGAGEWLGGADRREEPVRARGRTGGEASAGDLPVASHERAGGDRRSRPSPRQMTGLATARGGRRALSPAWPDRRTRDRLPLAGPGRFG